MSVLSRIVLFAACWLLAAPAFAEKRVALVIGNGAYKNAPTLANPKNDAEAMAAALKRMNFEVVAGIDLDKPTMERLLRDFVARLDNADLALVFYAGHGLQVHGRNYFVPVDAKLDRETDLAFEAVPLELVQQVMEQSRRTNILILDACRDNPLARNLARTMGTRSSSIGRGLGQTQAGIGTLIVYATQPGNVALDGDGPNSPFTTALLKHIETPGLEVRLIVSRVRQSVIEATRDKQVPWDSSSLVGEVYLAGSPAAPSGPAPAPQGPPAVTPPPAPAPSANNEALFWQTIKDSKNAADYKAYLARFPSGVFAELAKIRIAEIEKAAVTPPAPEKPTPPPGPPRRTSSMIPGQDLSGDMISGSGGKTATAQACAASCIARPQCAAWMFWTDQHSFTDSRRSCYLYGSAKPGHRNATTPPDRYAGFIRLAPAAVPAQPGVTPAQPRTAPAPPAPRPSVPVSGSPRDLCQPGSARYLGATAQDRAEPRYCPDFGFSVSNVRATGAVLYWSIPFPNGETRCACTLKAR